MAVERVAEFKAFNNPGASATVSITTSGLTVGDLLLATVTIPSTSATITPDQAGWTELVFTANTASTQVQSRTWRREAGAAGETYTWTLSTSQRYSAAIRARRGHDSTTPINAANQDATSVGTSHTTPSITTTVADCWIESIWANRIGGNNAGPSDPANRWTVPDTERVDIAGTNNTLNTTLAAGDTAAGVATGSYSKTATSADSALALAGIIAIAPAASGQTVAPTGLSVPIAVGSPTAAVTSTATPTGLAVPVAFGAPTAQAVSTATPTGLAVPVSLGTPTAASVAPAAPDGLSLPVVFGAPTVSFTAQASPDGLAVPVAFGTPAVSEPGGPQTVAPAGLAVPLAVGTPTVQTATAAQPAGVAVPVAFGAPVVTFTAIASPAGLAVPLTFGSPTLAIPGQVVTRPDTGTAARPSTGPVTRPSTGTVTRPSTGTVTRPFTGTIDRP